MSRVYKKVEVLNQKQKNFLKDIGVNPSELGLSQRRYLKKLINLLKPFLKDEALSNEAKKSIINFVEMTRFGCESRSRDVWRSIKSQIESQSKTWYAKSRIFEFNIDLLLKLRELYMFNLKKCSSDLAWKKMGVK